MPIEKRWVVKPQGDPATVEALASALRIPPVLANLLVQRGIDTEEKAHSFFNPQLSDLHDPFLMKDMDRAVERVEAAVRNQEKIMVYGDYDVDGTTAVALVYKFLRHIGHRNLLFYIPDRYTEGYGISVKGIDYAARKGVTLIIALDCGIKATEKVAYAKTQGVDFIICDHHLPAEEIPRAVAVLDPKRTDCTYPFDELSGCGVGFKLVQAYAMKNGMPFSSIAPLLDLLVVSIASDIVPLVGENRILAHYGLELLNRAPSKGLLSIIKICGLNKHSITIDDIVFKIGPRINAAGRMRMDENDENAAPSGGYAAVNLLVENNESDAEDYGSIIDAFNQDRKSIDRHVTQEAHEIIESDPELKNCKSTVIYNPRWMKGIVGIVASRLIETYFRPLRPLSGRGVVRRPAGKLRRAHVRRRAHDAAGERRGVHAEVQRLRRREHRSADARSAGGRRRRTALLGDHARIPPRAETVRTFRAGQCGADLRHAQRQQPRRRQTGGSRVRTPAHGPHAAAETQHDVAVHRLPAAGAFRMDPVGAAGGRMLSDRGEPLPRHGLDAAAHQGHQAGGEIARKRIAANRGAD